MKLFDLRHPFFRPLWRRVLVTVLCLAWAAVEFAGGAAFWGTLFAGIGALCVYEFFIVFDPANYEETE